MQEGGINFLEETYCKSPPPMVHYVKSKKGRAGLNENLLEFMETTIRPRVQADGGEVTVAGADEKGLRLVLMGECAVCACACGLRAWITAQVRERFGEHLEVTFTSQKRYFQDR